RNLWAGGPGFEPGTKVPKTLVIPFHHPPTVHAFQPRKYTTIARERRSSRPAGTGRATRGRARLLHQERADGIPDFAKKRGSFLGLLLNVAPHRFRERLEQLALFGRQVAGRQDVHRHDLIAAIAAPNVGGAP